MTRRLILVVGLLLASASGLVAHDLFIKLDSYFLSPGAAVDAPILNGTFSKSENAIARARVADLSLATPGGRTHPDTSALSEHGDTTYLGLRLEGPGTYVVGLATRPSEIRLGGKEFTAYLREEAIHDVLAARQRTAARADSVRERYSKYAKAIFQVGGERTPEAGTIFGYAAEIVPLGNPYAVARGGALRVRCLVEGKPAARQSLLVGGRQPGGARIPQRELRTDAEDIAVVRLTTQGRWYLKFIHMSPARSGPDYESRWATLTFEVR